MVRFCMARPTIKIRRVLGAGPPPRRLTIALTHASRGERSARTTIEFGGCEPASPVLDRLAYAATKAGVLSRVNPRYAFATNIVTPAAAPNEAF